MSFIRKTVANLVALAGALFVFWCTHVLVSPGFWASLSINEPWLIGVKIGAALVTFAILKLLFGGGQDGG